MSEQVRSGGRQAAWGLLLAASVLVAASGPGVAQQHAAMLGPCAAVGLTTGPASVCPSVQNRPGDPCAGTLTLAVVGALGYQATAAITCGANAFTPCTAQALNSIGGGLFYGECTVSVTGEKPLFCVAPAGPVPPGSGWAMTCG